MRGLTQRTVLLLGAGQTRLAGEQKAAKAPIFRGLAKPTGVLGLAAALRGRVDVAGKRVGVILSGGNVDLVAALELFRSAESR